jgi:hypothetical protein
LRDHENEFKQAGASLAAIGLGGMHYARAFREEAGITFPLLVDSGRIAYKAAELKSGNLFHLFRRENFEARAHARAAGLRQHRFGANPFQLGASFVFGPGIAICSRMSAGLLGTMPPPVRCWLRCAESKLHCDPERL